MTPGQAALADGFAVTLSQFGQTWTRTSDGATFTGVPGKIDKTDARMEGAQDRALPILIADLVLSPTIAVAQCMPSSGRLREGDQLTKVTSPPRYFAVIRADFEENTGLWTVLISPTY